MAGHSREGKVSLSPLSPGDMDYMAVQNGQMHFPLMEVAAGYSLVLLLPVSSGVESHGIPPGEQQRREHLLLDTSC